MAVCPPYIYTTMSHRGRWDHEGVKTRVAEFQANHIAQNLFFRIVVVSHPVYGNRMARMVSNLAEIFSHESTASLYADRLQTDCVPFMTCPHFSLNCTPFILIFKASCVLTSITSSTRELPTYDLELE